MGDEKGGEAAVARYRDLASADLEEQRAKRADAERKMSAETLSDKQAAREVREGMGRHEAARAQVASREASKEARAAKAMEQQKETAAQKRADKKAETAAALKRGRDELASRRQGSAEGYERRQSGLDVECAHASRAPGAAPSPGGSGGSEDDEEGAWDAAKQLRMERNQFASTSLQVVDVSLASRCRVASKQENIICLVVDTTKMPEKAACLVKQPPMWYPLTDVRMAYGGHLSRSYDTYLVRHDLGKPDDPDLQRHKFKDLSRPCCGRFGGSVTAELGTPQYNPWATSGRCGRPSCRWPREVP